MLTLITAQVGMNWTTALVTLAGGISATGIVKIVQVFTKARQAKRKALSADGLAFRKSLQERVLELEDKIDTLTEKIEQMIRSNAEIITDLKTEIATLKTENKYLKEELDKYQ